jgi:isopenicillin-N epimerase
MSTAAGPAPARAAPAPAALRSDFLLEPGTVFLNHGSFGACPRPVLAAQRRWQDEMERNPVQFLARRSGALLADARQALATWLGAPAQDLAFVPNATHGVNIVAQSLRIAPGDEVLTTDHEYGACVATWQRVCERVGARLRTVRVPLPFEPADFVAALMAAVTPRTRLIFASHITSTTALVFPVAALVAAARARGVPVLVDGAHAPGQVPLALDALGADFTTGNLHKWLCAPKGAAFLHVRREHHARILPPVHSWGDLDEAAHLPQMQAITGSDTLQRRLQWQGTRDLSAFLAVPDAIAYQQAHDWPAQQARCRALLEASAARIAARNGMAPIAAGADAAPQMRAIPVRAPARPEVAERLRAILFERHRIEVPVTLHGTRSFVRVSVQAYNEEADLAALEAALAEVGV